MRNIVQPKQRNIVQPKLIVRGLEKGRERERSRKSSRETENLMRKK